MLVLTGQCACMFRFGRKYARTHLTLPLTPSGLVTP
jgi:hypothetical protein